MESLLHKTEEENSVSRFFAQALSLFLHTALALAAWFAIMLVGYALNPASVSQTLILLLSIFIPLVVGNLVTRIRQNEMALLVWLIGLIWILIISLWILDLPTGPNQCFQCEATEKLMRTLFSFPKPSGLIDNDGPFLATWPTAALFGYSIGAQLAFRRRSRRNVS
jgi:hypothetical protein